MYVEEEEQQDKGHSADGEIDPVIPAPGHIFGKCSPEKRADGSRQRPHALGAAEIETSVSHTEKVGDSDDTELDQSSAGRALESTSC